MTHLNLGSSTQLTRQAKAIDAAVHLRVMAQPELTFLVRYVKYTQPRMPETQIEDRRRKFAPDHPDLSGVKS